MRIKNIIIAFTLLLSLAGNAQTPFSDRAPLDSVPEWVKEKVTPKEYEIWKTMSSVFYIDYSILKTELSPKRKQEIYDGLKKICEELKKGNFQIKLVQDLLLQKKILLIRLFSGSYVN